MLYTVCEQYLHLDFVKTDMQFIHQYGSEDGEYYYLFQAL